MSTRLAAPLCVTFCAALSVDDGRMTRGSKMNTSAQLQVRKAIGALVKRAGTPVAVTTHRPVIAWSAAAAVASAMMMPVVSNAQSWAEVGDAGDLVSSAQRVAGTGALVAITGQIACCRADIDMFEIVIPGAFSATVSVRFDGYVHNSRLFLFGPSLVAQTPTPSQSPVVSYSAAGRPGNYFLAIAPDSMEPSGGGWGGSYSPWPFDYTIQLSGAQFVAAPAVPEPQTYILMLAGLCALTVAARRNSGPTTQRAR